MPFRRYFALAAILFLGFKLVLLGAPFHWEELRDMDVFLRVAEGSLPYKDFYWHYGPLAPLVYGTFLKVLPQNLFSVRIISLFVNFAVLWLSFSLLVRYVSGFSAAIGAVIATAVLGNPNYSHNHVSVQAFLLAAAYFWICYREDRKEKDLLLSFVCVLGVLFTRPVLTGYGALACWFAFYLHSAVFVFPKSKAQHVKSLSWCAGILATCFAVTFFIYGSTLSHAFIPRGSAVYPSHGYPNLHAVVALLSLKSFDAYSVLIALRTGLDAVFFHFHFFIWPTLLLTICFIQKTNTRAAVALTIWGYALAGSLDVLYLGDVSPQVDPIMLNRGQYFLVLTACSVLVFLWPRKGEGIKNFFSSSAIALVAFFMMIPWAGNMYKLKVSQPAPQEFAVLKGISVHPSLGAVLDSLSFANSHCNTGTPIYFGRYSPGHARLVKCRDILAQDDHLLDLSHASLLKQNESLLGGGLVSDIISRKISSENPSVIVTAEGGWFNEMCDKPGWEKKEFSHIHGTRLVCWQSGTI